MAETAEPPDGEPAATSGIGMDSLAAPTKKGEERALISLERDMRQMKTVNNTLKTENDKLTRNLMILSESNDKLGLDQHKLSQSCDREKNEHRKYLLLSEKLKKELDELKTKNEAERIKLQGLLSEGDAKTGKLNTELHAMQLRLQSESTNLRQTRSGLETLEKKHVGCVPASESGKRGSGERGSVCNSQLPPCDLPQGQAERAAGARPARPAGRRAARHQAGAADNRLRAQQGREQTEKAGRGDR